MALETTVFTFKISVPFADWAKGFDSTEVVAMHKANSIRPLDRGVSKDDPESVIVSIKQKRVLQNRFLKQVEKLFKPQVIYIIQPLLPVT